MNVLLVSVCCSKFATAKVLRLKVCAHIKCAGILQNVCVARVGFKKFY